MVKKFHVNREADILFSRIQDIIIKKIRKKPPLKFPYNFEVVDEAVVLAPGLHGLHLQQQRGQHVVLMLQATQRLRLGQRCSRR